MEIKNVHRTARTSIRYWLVCAALGGVSLSQAQPIEPTYPMGRNAFDYVSQRLAGTIGSAAVGNTPAGYTPSTVTPQNLSGWTRAGNYGLNPSATGATVGGKFNGTINGRTVPLTASASIPKAGILLGVGKLLPIIGNVIAIGQFLDGMEGAMQAAQVQKNDDPATAAAQPFRYAENECDAGGCYVYKVVGGGYTAIANSAYSACSQWAGWAAGNQGVPYAVQGSTTDTQCDIVRNNNQLVQIGIQKELAPGLPTYKNANWDEVRPKFETADFPLAPLVKAQLDAIDRANKNGIDSSGWSIPVGKTTVSGPNALEPYSKTETTTTTGKDSQGRDTTITTTKTTTTTTPLTYDGDQVKSVPRETVVTTVKTTDADGNQTSTTDTKTEETESTKPNEEQTDFCVEHPDVLACAKPDLDTPDGEIPKDTKTITYQAEDVFGAGSCPANVTMNSALLHSQITVWDWTETCRYALPLRALVIALATFAAFLIVMPGSERT